MAATSRVWAGLAIRRRSRAALLLIRIEKLTPDLVPIQHRIAGVSEPVERDGQVVEVFEVLFDRLADDRRPAPPELSSSLVERCDHGIW